MKAVLRSATATAALALGLLSDPVAGAETNATYSTWMASSLMSRGDGIMTGTGGSAEPLHAGFTQKALSALLAQYPEGEFAASAQAYLRTSADSVAKFLSNATNNALTYSMDRLSNGNALLNLARALPQSNDTAALAVGANALYDSIALNRRNAEGGLWYFVYPDWSYLDGMYSLGPFMALWAAVTPVDQDNATTATAQMDEMLFQIELVWNHARNATSGLLVHGYDGSHTAVWADPVTGASPHVWGRALGWFAMALVDTVELLPQVASRHRDRLLDMYRSLVPALLATVDPQTGGWWQIVDYPGREGNYIESSGSAMFAYALLKGARLAYVDGEVAAQASAAGVRAQRLLTDEFVVHEEGGTLGYNGTVSVCSLNSTASYEYYTGRPILYNSIHGSAAYILASLEAERLEI